MKIALFGTSADPPTAAHQAICVWLAQQFDRVAVWASDNPFKQHHSSLGDRQRMLQLLVSHLATPCDNVQVWSDLSDRRSLISWQRAQNHWGTDHDYFLVIGSDLIAQIPQWYEVETLLRAVTLIIFPRPGYPLTTETLAPLKQLGGRYQVATPLAIGQVNALPTVTPLTPAVSSSGYRQGKDPHAIPRVIQAYIEAHHLYENRESS